MIVLFGYFLIAAATGIAASAVIGYFLANLIDRRFLKTEVEHNGPARVYLHRRSPTSSEQIEPCQDKHATSLYEYMMARSKWVKLITGKLVIVRRIWRLSPRFPDRGSLLFAHVLFRGAVS